jgi:peptidoglycan/LPS O-acetylase OafA/YrhL
LNYSDTIDTRTRSTRINTNLDFLRAFAVLLVVVGHLTRFFDVSGLGPISWMGLGGLGVAIFFVHTALVLMLSLEREARNSSTLFVPFLIRRCFRIYPLSMLVVLAVAIFHLPQATISPGTFAGWNFDGSDMLANLFLVQDLSFRVPILGPTWSLPFELQMYLWLPAIFVFLRRARPMWQFGAIYALIVSACTVMAHYSSTRNLAFFVPCFLGGIIAYQLRNRTAVKAPAWLWPCFVVVLGGGFLTTSMSRFDEWAVCLLLGLAIPAFAQISSSVLNAASATIAKYSYGIYLTHFFVIWLAFQKLAPSSTALKATVFVSLGAGLPVIFYYLIEEPMISFGKKAASRYVEERQARCLARELHVRGDAASI